MKICDKNQNVGFNFILNRYRLKKILKHAKGKTCLEVGCGEGQMTTQLVKYFNFVTALDADNEILRKIPDHERLVKITGTIEEVNEIKDIQFDTIICTNFLEHVNDPSQVLDILRKFGHKDTVYIFSTPNAYSFNRLIGTELGMLSNPTDLHNGDKTAGHQRVFTPIQFKDVITKSGYEFLKFNTIFYKPLPNSDMEKIPLELVKKYMEMELPNSGAEIFAVCKKGE